MSQGHLLIVDDEVDILELVTITCARMGISSRGAQTLNEARQCLGAERFDLCLTDMRLPDGDGIDLVRQIVEHHPHTAVAVLTAYGNIDTAVAAMKAGAFDFVSKPVDLKVLRDLIRSALRLGSSPPLGLRTTPASDLIGTSLAIRETRTMVQKLARNQAPVFITGESGTGKELAARLIHEQGPRHDLPFVPVNCGAIPEDLIESELFGHRRGSFTGAFSDKPGLFLAAQGGTLFLDEIADLPLPMQVKLLRAIQEKRVRPVGSEQEIAVDVRIISASHCNLEAAVERGAFRKDLYYRVKVIDLLMPPLRSRPEDIPLLAEHILARIAPDPKQRKRLSDEAMHALARHPFPGNVRELQNILERANALADGRVLGVEDLQLPYRLPDDDSQDSAQTQDDAARPLEDRLDEIERHALLTALEATRWNRTQAAKRLGMTPRSLRYRLSKFGLS
jgi:two-component system response regulator PilR (NtrC family)